MSIPPLRKPLHILVVDDDPGHGATLKTLISDWGYTVTVAESGEAALELCHAQPFDLVLMDVRMAGMSGLEALKGIKAYNPAIPIIIMTAYSAVNDAVEAIKSGAYDYLTKPLDFEDLKLTLDRALDHASLRDENRVLRSALDSMSGARGVIGQSPAMRQVMDMVQAIAPSEATVLITGASGTGKEIIARLLHANSGRAKGPFVAVNCAALTETLLESELFGHEKGAFTGAEKQRDGRFMSANNGVIFLDEIGEISPAMQAKLLRAVQEKEIQRVGGDKVLKVDVRILAATNRDLLKEVETGRFRQDLYYRLHVVSVHMPELKDRPEDIPLLARHFLTKFAAANQKDIKGFTPSAMDWLIKHPWPGNVRELENIVERAVVLLVGDYISERELPPSLVGEQNAGAQAAPDLTALTTNMTLNMTLDEIERLIVREAVENTGGNKSEAARRLGITRKTLLAKMQ